jgi:hypothetical protein
VTAIEGEAVLLGPNRSQRSFTIRAARVSAARILAAIEAAEADAPRLS